MFKYLSLCILIMSLALSFPSCSSDNGHNEPSCDTVLIMLGLDRRDGSLADFVEQVSFPDSPSYGQYLTMTEMKLGPTAGAITYEACVKTAETLFCYQKENEPGWIVL